MTTKKEIKLKRFKVKVLPECGDEIFATRYQIIAADPMDARIIAFAIDGGFPTQMEEMNAGDIELVKMYTEILK